MLHQNIPVDFQVIVDFSNETIPNSKTQALKNPAKNYRVLVLKYCYSNS
jgi:hypothetical protein